MLGKAQSNHLLETIDIRLRIQSERQPSHVATTLEGRYRGWAYEMYPLHNLFDALGFIYTLCIDGIDCDRDGELYLLQLRFITASILATGCISRKGIPATVGASWQKTSNERLRVSFAFSCIGNEKQRVYENRSLCRYVDYLYAIRKPIDKSKKKAPNKPENCSEFLTWRMVCRDAGVYQTLCIKKWEITQ